MIERQNKNYISYQDLANKVVIVTGAAQGIGEAIARSFEAVGAKVLAVDLEDVIFVPTDRKSGNRRICRADVSKADNVRAMIDFCLHELGTPDVLINVAAISIPRPITNMDLAEWQKVIDVNLTSVFLCTKAVLPEMIKKCRGSIINFSSVIAHTGGETSAHYTAAKAGVEGYSRTLALELGPYNIRVNVVAPGMIDTRMLALMPEAQKRKIAAKMPLRRVGQPEDLVGVALLLASEAGSYITGQTFHINGGLFLT